MSDWKTEIGDFPKLQAVSVANAIGQRMNFWMTSLKDDFCKDLETPNEFTQYRTIEQLLNPPTTTEEGEDGKTKEKKEKLTWHGVRNVAKKDADGKSLKDEDGKVIHENVEGDWPMSNFSTVPSPVKRAAVYLANRYFHEALEAFTENGNTFGNDALKVVSEYSTTSKTPSIAAMIIAVAAKGENMSAMINDDNCSNDKHKMDDVNNKIVNIVTDYFKVNNKSPQLQLRALTDTFVKFLRVLSVFSANSLYENHKAINMTFFKVQLRNAFSMVYADGLVLTPEFIEKLDNYIESWDVQAKAEAAKRKADKAANPKSTKSDKKDKEEADAEEADEDADADADAEPEPEPPKKTTKKTTKEATPPKETKKTTKETTKEKEPAKETKETKKPTKKTTKKKDDDFDDVDQDA